MASSVLRVPDRYVRDFNAFSASRTSVRRLFRNCRTAPQSPVGRLRGEGRAGVRVRTFQPHDVVAGSRPQADADVLDVLPDVGQIVILVEILARHRLNVAANEGERQ